MNPLTRSEARPSVNERANGRFTTTTGLIRAFPSPSGGERSIPEASPSPDVVARDAFYKRSLALSDVFAATMAAFAAVVALGGARLAWPAVFVLPAIVLVAKAMGLYDRDEVLLHKSTLDEAPAVFQLATIGALLLWLGDGVFTRGLLGRPVLVELWGLLFVYLLVARGGVRFVARRLTAAERCLVIGDVESAEGVRRKLESSFSLHAEYVGRVALEDGRVERRGSLGGLTELGIVLMEHDVHRVIIAVKPSDSDRILDCVRLVKALGVKVSVLPSLFEVVGSSVEFDEMGGLPLLGLRRHGLSRSSQALKRGMDVVGASIALVLLAPLLAIIAGLVKLSSRGPVLFRQTRIGRGGGQFEMLKFRTMVDGADELKAELMALNEADGLFKIADDPRCTPVGRLLRRASLDELPQLLNVLRGEMSLVGPRPLVEDDDARIEGWHRRRLGLTPGMTGIWQVLGSSRIPLHDMVKLDYLYAANWSLWLDTKILLRTVPHVVGRRGL